jgi:hypothetical protein
LPTRYNTALQTNHVAAWATGPTGFVSGSHRARSPAPSNLPVARAPPARWLTPNVTTKKKQPHFVFY